MSLIKKLAQKGKCLALAGSVYLAGCAPMTPDEQQKRDERLLMLGLGYASITEEDPQKSAAMGLTSQILRDYDVAREGRSKTNITLVQEAAPIVPKRIEIPRNSFFTCNYFRGDLNNNGNSEPEEFEGYRKKTFDSNEKINMIFLIKYPFHFKKILSLKVYGPDNKEISTDHYYTERGLGKSYELKSKKQGKYYAEWRIQDEIIGTLDFEVVNNEMPQNTPKRIFKPIIPN